MHGYTFDQYVRDVILTGDGSVSDSIRRTLGASEVDAARERLARRTPANTLSGDVPGVIPGTHIEEVVGVIDASRPIVSSATRTTLDRGRLMYPAPVTLPAVARQTDEKTEAGNTTLQLDAETEDAAFYLGGGDVSWQALNWSTPDVLALWFAQAAAAYAQATERHAGHALTEAGLSNIVSNTIGATPDLDDLIAALSEAGAGIAASGEPADTLYVAPDEVWQFARLASLPVSLVVSSGLNAGVAILGRASDLVVAESPGAPVELRLLEPAIGGLEVGVLGAFAAVAPNPDRFSLLTAVS